MSVSTLVSGDFQGTIPAGFLGIQIQYLGLCEKQEMLAHTDSYFRNFSSNKIISASTDSLFKLAMRNPGDFCSLFSVHTSMKILLPV